MNDLSKLPTKRAEISRAEKNAALREKAARQAAKAAKAGETVETVTCRVLKKGDSKISTGDHVAGIGEVHFEYGETFTIERPNAEALEERGFVEIMEAP